MKVHFENATQVGEFVDFFDGEFPITNWDMVRCTVDVDVSDDCDRTAVEFAREKVCPCD